MCRPQHHHLHRKLSCKECPLKYTEYTSEKLGKISYLVGKDSSLLDFFTCFEICIVMTKQKFIIIFVNSTKMLNVTLSQELFHKYPMANTFIIPQLFQLRTYSYFLILRILRFSLLHLVRRQKKYTGLNIYMEMFTKSSSDNKCSID